jgi:aldose sugar dehydrogenase
MAAAAGLPCLIACGALGDVPDGEGPGTAPLPGATHAYRVVTVAEGLDRPWGMAFLPDGRILVTERAGRLRLVQDGRLVPEPLSGVPPVDARGQGGLLDVALHPGFASNRLVYLSYSRASERGATTAVARGVLEGNRLTAVRDIFETQAHSPTGQHFGSRLLFDRQGYLYVTVGDRGQMQRAQDRADHAGTTLRLHDDGRVPADNPFVGQSGVRPEIYTYGNRNAQGMALHPTTGRVWQTEHGPMGGDEVNLVLPGRNYGWPRVSHGRNYDGSTLTPDTVLPGMESPLLHWTPSIAPSGLVIYDGDAFPAWRGSLFSGALAGQHLRRVVFEGTRPVAQESLLTELRRRVRDVRQGPDGFLYLLFDEPNSPLVRLEPTEGGS